MSQSQQITLGDLEGWLKKQTTGILEPLRNKGKDLLREIRERQNDASLGSQKLVESSQRELDKSNPKTYRFARNANKFAKSLSQSIEAAKVPEEVSYESLQALLNDLGRLVNSMDQLRREAYPYITPYFIFDRRRLDVALKRLADMYPKLQNFLATSYAKAKTAEEVSATINRLRETISQAKDVKNELEQAQQKERLLQEKLQDSQQKIANIRNKVELTDLLKTEEQIKELRESVKQNLRYLQKPFFKLQSLARSGEVAIPVDEAKKLGDYLTDPFDALATEPNGYPILKSILKKLDEAINRNRLKLKSTRLRKAQEQIDSLLNKDSLGGLYKNCFEVQLQKNKMLASSMVLSFQDELMQLQNELRGLQKEYEFTSSRCKALENESKKLRERTENLKDELEKTVFQLTNRNIQIAF